SGAAGRSDATKCFRELLTVIRKVLPQYGPAGERNKEDFVILLNSAAESLDSFNGRANLSIHAAAGVQQNPDTHRHVLILAEVCNLLRLSVFLENEIVGGKVRNVAAASVGARRYTVHQPNIHSDLA